MMSLGDILIHTGKLPEQRDAKRKEIDNLKRIRILKEYAKKQRDIIKNYPIIEQKFRKEDFLARSAETLIYIMHNREALRNMDRDIFKGNKKLMDKALSQKRIGRQVEPLGQPLHVMVNFEVVKTIEYAI